MRVLLRSGRTGQYYFTDHTWVRAASRAYDFHHAEYAIQHALARNWAGVELVLTCDNSGGEVVLPLWLKRRPADGDNGPGSQA